MSTAKRSQRTLFIARELRRIGLLDPASQTLAWHPYDGRVTQFRVCQRHAHRRDYSHADAQAVVEFVKRSSWIERAMRS